MGTSVTSFRTHSFRTFCEHTPKMMISTAHVIVLLGAAVCLIPTITAHFHHHQKCVDSYKCRHPIFRAKCRHGWNNFFGRVSINYCPRSCAYYLPHGHKCRPAPTTTRRPVTKRRPTYCRDHITCGIHILTLKCILGWNNHLGRHWIQKCPQRCNRYLPAGDKCRGGSTTQAPSQCNDRHGLCNVHVLTLKCKLGWSNHLGRHWIQKCPRTCARYLPPGDKCRPTAATTRRPTTAPTTHRKPTTKKPTPTTSEKPRPTTVTKPPTAAPTTAAPTTAAPTMPPTTATEKSCPCNATTAATTLPPVTTIPTLAPTTTLPPTQPPTTTIPPTQPPTLPPTQPPTTTVPPTQPPTLPPTQPPTTTVPPTQPPTLPPTQPPTTTLPPTQPPTTTLPPTTIPTTLPPTTAAPTTLPPTTKPLPLVPTRDDICRNWYGDCFRHAADAYRETDDRCEFAYCTRWNVMDAGFRLQSSNEELEGTVCAPGKLCRSGKCVAGEAAKVDGGWTAFDDYVRVKSPPKIGFVHCDTGCDKKRCKFDGQKLLESTYRTCSQPAISGDGKPCAGVNVRAKVCATCSPTGKTFENEMKRKCKRRARGKTAEKVELLNCNQYKCYYADGKVDTVSGYASIPNGVGCGNGGVCQEGTCLTPCEGKPDMVAASPEDCNA